MTTPASVTNAAPGHAPEPAAEPKKSARERILEVAAEMFRNDGVRATGIDTIIARSGVAKMSLYRNFASKDDLVGAFLKKRNESYWGWWDRVTGAAADDPRAKIRAVFEAVATLARAPHYRGCSFINVAIEFPDPEHPGFRQAVVNKKELARRFAKLAGQAGAKDPARLGGQLVLLLDGVYATAPVLREDVDIETIVAAADALIAAAAKA